MEIRGLPSRYKLKTLGTFEMGDQREKVMSAVNALKAGRSVFLSGRPGSGKTHLAVGLLYLKYADWLNRLDSPNTNEIYPSFIFLPSVELFLELKASFGRNDQSENDVLSGYVRSGDSLLVIDDVGAEKISDWSRQMFYTLVDRLYRSERQVIITSNLSLDQLSVQIDDRIASRLVEMGEIITLDPNDYRLKSGMPKPQQTIAATQLSANPPLAVRGSAGGVTEVPR